MMIQGLELTPKVGSFIVPDGWYLGQNLVASDWDKAQFRIESRMGLKLAINVTVTGRTLKRKSMASWIRVRVEFVGDCEPSQFHPGWMLV